MSDMSEGRSGDATMDATPVGTIGRFGLNFGRVARDAGPWSRCPFAARAMLRRKCAVHLKFLHPHEERGKLTNFSRFDATRRIELISFL